MPRFRPTQLPFPIITLAVLLGLVPLGIYWTVLGHAPTVHPAEAIASLEKQPDLTALVDVRAETVYQERHILGAISLPIDQIMRMGTAGALPAELQGKTLYLVCAAGVFSAQAAQHFEDLGVSAYNVRGGIQDWGRAWPQFQDSLYSRFEQAGGVIQEPFREMSPVEQGAAALALLWIKPTYMLLSGIISIFLLRRKAADLRALGWSLMVFLIGEIFCAINYLFLKDNSYFSEYMHSYSMAIAFGLAAYALFEGLDERMLHLRQADKHCAMLPVCGPCAKYQPVRCGIRRIAQLLGIALVILGIIPLLSPYSYTAYNTKVFTFNHYYTRPLVHQWFEARFSPLTAISLIILALTVIKFTPHITLHPLARNLLCLGTGFLGFGLFRVALGMIFAERLAWATAWEEFTELMFIASVIFILWVFQHSLLPDFEIKRLLRDF